MSEPLLPKKRRSNSKPSPSLPRQTPAHIPTSTPTSFASAPTPTPTTTSSASAPTPTPTPTTTTPPPSSPLNPLSFPPVPTSELTPAELVDGLTRVVDQLKELVENPSKKPLAEEVGKKMEEIRVLTTFLSAVYANMIRIAVEEKGETPTLPTEEQSTLAKRTEALQWTVRALQDKIALHMRPPTKKVPLSAHKRKSRMQRTQGDGEWKRM